MEERQVYKYVLRGTEKQLAAMENVINYESFRSDDARKYFHVWVHAGTGVYCFPKEKYFVSYDGETNYAVAILNYGGKVKGEVYGK